jgi:hypothetical protein
LSGHALHASDCAYTNVELEIIDFFIRLRRRPRACPWINAKTNIIATARCHPRNKADNRGVAEGEDGYFNETKGLPVGIHCQVSGVSIFCLKPETDYYGASICQPDYAVHFGGMNRIN